MAAKPAESADMRARPSRHRYAVGAFHHRHRNRSFKQLITESPIHARTEKSPPQNGERKRRILNSMSSVRAAATIHTPCSANVGPMRRPSVRRPEICRRHGHETIFPTARPAVKSRRPAPTDHVPSTHCRTERGKIMLPQTNVRSRHGRTSRGEAGYQCSPPRASSRDAVNPRSDSPCLLKKRLSEIREMTVAADEAAG